MLGLNVSCYPTNFARMCRFYRPFKSIGVNLSTLIITYSNPSPQQLQEPLLPPNQPQFSPPLVVSRLFHINLSLSIGVSESQVRLRLHSMLKTLSTTRKMLANAKTDSENLVPEIVIGNKTVTPTANPVGLSVFNGTFTGHPITASASGVASPTGGNFTTTPEIFQGRAALNKADAWLAVWATGFLGLGAFVYYM